MQLNLTEIYRSIQGETTATGLPTTFIRLAACNLRCVWCDTPYSFGRGTPFSLEDILQQTKEFNCRFVCITGGEPLLQEEVYPLITKLLDLDYQVSIETGGSLPTDQVDPRAKVILDIKCPGSGMEEKNCKENLSLLRPHDEVKFVLADRADYDYAKEVTSRYSLEKKVASVLFSPVHGAIDPKELIDWVLNDSLPVRVNLQLHKYIWSIDTVGV